MLHKLLMLAAIAQSMEELVDSVVDDLEVNIVYTKQKIIVRVKHMSTGEEYSLRARGDADINEVIAHTKAGLIKKVLTNFVDEAEVDIQVKH